MAIGTNDAIDKFGTQDTLGTTSAAVADDAFSIAGDLSTWVNDDDTREVFFVLLANFSVAPAANSVINLFARPLNIVGTNDAEVPDANMKQGFLGSFIMNDVTTEQTPWLISRVPNSYTSSNHEFFIENKTTQSLPSGWDLSATPLTLGPKA
jgi:hypothetical protein